VRKRMLTFRNIINEDIERIADLEKEIFSDAWTSKSIEETSMQSQAFIIVALEEEQVAGYCIVYHVLDEGEIARIAVGQKWRRNGVGRRLLDYTCKCCREKNIKKLLLDVREGNEAARAFYEDYGFAEDGIRKNFYINPTEHAVLMSRMVF